jgi:hypothetical protein
MTALAVLFAKSGLIPRRSAAAQIRQRLQKFGIKPDGIINFLTERASAQTNTTPKIPQGSALRRLIDFKDKITTDHRKIIRELVDKNKFNKIRVERHTLCWENGVDFAPEYLYDQIKRRQKSETGSTANC